MDNTQIGRMCLQNTKPTKVWYEEHIKDSYK